MRYRSLAIGIISLILMGSCTTLYEFPIEVSQPAKVNLSPNIKNITLVSRNLKYRSDTLQHFESRNNKLVKDNVRLNIDSITINACFDSLSAKLYQQQRFSKINILPLTTLPRKYVQKINPPAKAQIQQIASDTQADALILLDMFSAFYSINPVADDNKLIAQVVTASIWTIYDPATYRILQHQSLIDTLYWDGLDEQGSYLSSRIPAKKDALAIAAGLAGAKYSKNLVPYWSQVNRQIFTSKKDEFSVASTLAKKNKWEEASAIWAQYTDSKNKRFRLQAMYNLAVAREMDGDIEGAQQLITEALAIAPAAAGSTEKKIMRTYSAILAKRKMELEKINAINYEN